MATMLQLVQQVTQELGLAVPTSVAGNTYADTQQILGLMNAAGAELLTKADWQALDTEYRFTTQFVSVTGTTTAGSPVVTGVSSTTGIAANLWMVTGTGIAQDCYVKSVDAASQLTLTQNATASGTVTLLAAQVKYPMPADFDRIVNRTEWDKSKHWEMLGPSSPQQWQWLKSGYISTGPRIRWRILGGYVQLWPALSTNEYLGFEYISKNWVLDSSSNAKASFTADTDTAIYNDRLLVLGTKLKYFEVKGFDTTALKRDFDEQLESRIAMDQGSRTLSMGPRTSQVLVGVNNIPDSGYGQ